MNFSFLLSCADISISPKDNHILLPALTSTTTTTRRTPFFLFPFLDPVAFPSNIEHFPIFVYPTATTTEPTTTTPTTSTTSTTTTTTTMATTKTPMNFILPFGPLEEFLNQLNKNNKTRRCYPTNEVLKPVIGIENWCFHLCAIHCPPGLCACLEV